ncbi:hypothetical protein [Alkalicoccus luteus]|uniref:Uncharacterized protein n=1 Tax=Alkalicoccus luteus TaxID=1237094 RepID=A0A969PQX7_9BACI|nr:hypothetical protein [Alkalicoccus luteus]NJP38780.1 hypothetical protein [Alkalicoccus luteus]
MEAHHFDKLQALKGRFVYLNNHYKDLSSKALYQYFQQFYWCYKQSLIERPDLQQERARAYKDWKKLNGKVLFSSRFNWKQKTANTVFCTNPKLYEKIFK